MEVNMQNMKNRYQSNQFIKGVIFAIVIIFGFFIMAMPILKTASASLTHQRLIFLLGILTYIFLPTIIYGIIAIRRKNMEYVIIPAIFLLSAESYFFHDYEIWIASNANAAIGLIIIPIYIIVILGVSYGIAYIFFNIRKYFGR